MLKLEAAVVDIDGSLFNAAFEVGLYYVIANEGDFLEEYGNKPFLTAEEEIWAAEKLRQIRACLAKKNLMLEKDQIVQAISADLTRRIVEMGQAMSKANGIDMNQLGAHLVITPDMQLALLTKHVNYMNKLDKTLIGDICVAANRNLMGSIVKRRTSFDKLVVLNGSYRQSYALDVKAMEMNGTGSAFIALPCLVAALRQQLGEETVILDKITLTDMYAGLEPGTSFQRIEDGATYHANCILDNSKGSHTYGFAHHLAWLNKTADITLYVYGDVSEILDKQFEMYQKDADLLPNNVTVVFQLYNGNLSVRREVKGTGIIDEQYYMNVRRIAELCGHDLQTYEIGIDSVFELKRAKFKKDRLAMAAAIVIAEKKVAAYFVPPHAEASS